MILSILAGMVGPWQIVIIAVIALLFFGGKKIPELMKGLGQGMKEFKKATNMDSDDRDSDEDKSKEDK